MKNLLLILAMLPFLAFSQNTVKNTSIAVKDSVDFSTPYEFQPQYQLDSLTGVTRVWDNGAWWMTTPDPTKPILRLPSVGDTIKFFDWYYFVAPTVSLSVSGGTLFEVGTSNTITLSGSTTNPANTTLSGGVLNRTSPSPTTQVLSIGANASYTTQITFTPQQGGTGDYNELSYTFRTSQSYAGAESGSINSPSRSINAVYPVLYGVSSTDLHTGGDAYTTLTKLVQNEGNKTVTMDGSGFIYYAIPTTWSDTALSAIFDANGFNVTPSFDTQTVSVSSSGLTNNWTIDYVIYKLNSQTTLSNADYTFNR